MTDLERALKRFYFAVDAIDMVRDLANQDRKVSGDKNVNGHYTKALQELVLIRDHADNQLRRAQAAAKAADVV